MLWLWFWKEVPIWQHAIGLFVLHGGRALVVDVPKPMGVNSYVENASTQLMKIVLNIIA